MPRWVGIALLLFIGLLTAYIVLVVSRLRDGTDALEQTLKSRLVTEAVTACNAAAGQAGQPERFSEVGLRRAHFRPWKLLLTTEPAADITLETEGLRCRYDFVGKASVSVPTKDEAE
jgi:hypothetical protein